MYRMLRNLLRLNIVKLKAQRRIRTDFQRLFSHENFELLNPEE